MTGRPRASAVVLRNDGGEILMVRHRRVDGTEYWQLPGGGLKSDETAESAALRELREETGPRGRVVRHLFTIPYRLGESTTFLVDIDGSYAVKLGVDPEESEFEHRKLAAVAWVALDDVRDNPEVHHAMRVLKDTY